MFKIWAHAVAFLPLLSSTIPSVAATPTSSSPTNNTVSVPAKEAASETCGETLEANISSCLLNPISVNAHFHIPDTVINLNLISFGDRLPSWLISQTVDDSIATIAPNVSFRPTEHITNGFFRHLYHGRHYHGVEIFLYQYQSKVVTWHSLNQILLGLKYFTRKSQHSRELDFEVDIGDQGRTAFGSLRYVPANNIDLSKRSAPDLPSHLLDFNESSIVQPNLTHHLLPLDSSPDVMFSYHFFGRFMPASAVVRTFRFAQQTIAYNVHHHPNDNIRDGLFKYQFDSSLVGLSVQASVDKELTWLLLDSILMELLTMRWGRHFLREFLFDFEIYPFEESYGHGSMGYVYEDKQVPENFDAH